MIQVYSKHVLKYTEQGNWIFFFDINKFQSGIYVENLLHTLEGGKSKEVKIIGKENGMIEVNIYTNNHFMYPTLSYEVNYDELYSYLKQMEPFL